MKNLLLSVLFVSLFANILFAQSQSEQAAQLPEGKYTAFKKEDNNLTATAKPWGVSFTKDGSIVTEININRLGVVQEDFKADLKENPAYYMFEGLRAIIIEGKIFYYSFSGGNAYLKYVLVPQGGKVEGNVEEWNKTVVIRQKATLGNQNETRKNIEEERKVKEAAEIAASSLRGKSVKSLSIVLKDGLGKTTHSSIVNYGVEVTLADGKVVKTNSLGGKLPWDDLDIKVSGGVYTQEAITINDDASKIPGDKVTITVKSKYHPVSDTKSFDVHYNSSLEANYSGKFSSMNVSEGQKGVSGKSLIVKTTSGKTSSGVSVTKVEIQDASGSVLHRYKLASGNTITIYANGGKGVSSSKNKRGGDGGNGGDVTIYLDPSVGGNPVIVNNGGGKGGKNSSSALLNGSSGSDGSTRTVKQSVTLNW